MFASIYSRDWNKPSAGKPFTICTSLCSPATAGKSGTEQYLEFTATEYDSHGTGKRGGAVREIERVLTLRFTEKDLRWLMEQAAKAGMFLAPGMAELLSAHAALSNCIEQLGLVPAS